MEQSLSFIPASNEIQPPTVGAGFGIRFGARIIDTIIHNLTGVVFALATGAMLGLYAFFARVPVEELTAKGGSTSLLDFVFALIGSILFHTICEYIYGASPGKLILKIHVRQENGQPISFGAAFIRSIAYFIDSLVFGLVAYENMKKSPLKQRLGDNWAKTVVVKRSDLTRLQLPPWWKFILAFGIAAFVDGLVATLPIMLRLL